ncbi:hypothetical protein GCM10009665_28720 [Kitasatospora nipponensis]|uniref:Bulb-type lectin domain-containing protein n=1 Tax=Kitasatospora nipponensis TaxID=258049 RepID=A0ABN1W5T2_9ACTN
MRLRPRPRRLLSAALATAATVAALLTPTAAGVAAAAPARPNDAWVPCTAASPVNVVFTGGFSFINGMRFCVGAYQLVMQHDGNMVIYGNTGVALWDTQTEGFPGDHAIMQSDGNLVVYQGTQWLWNSRTGGRPGAYLCFQTDGNLVVYGPPEMTPTDNCDPRNSPALWASKT